MKLIVIECPSEDARAEMVGFLENKMRQWAEAGLEFGYDETEDPQDLHSPLEFIIKKEDR